MDKTPCKSTDYVEILGDTVSPTHVIFSIAISTTLGLGGFLIGKRIFPAIASEKMVASYALLLGIGGCVLALILCALLFHPKRVLTETKNVRDRDEILKDLQINSKEELDALENDPVTRKEMEDLAIMDIFIPDKEGK